MTVQNISLTQGATYVAAVSVESGGVGVPLDGYDVRYEAHLPTTLVRDSDNEGEITFLEDDGEVTFTINPADTASLTIDGSVEYVHECRVRSPTGEVSVVFTGRIIIEEALFTDMDPA